MPRPDPDADRRWQLDDNCLIGSGHHHRCYRHPADDSRCIKVLQPGRGEKVLRREISYYAHLRKRNIDWDHIARFFGTVATSRGIGAVFELVRNSDGSPASSLSTLLQAAAPPLGKAELAAEINRVIRYIYHQSIVLSDLNLRNLMWQAGAGRASRLVVVDGIGHNDFIPLCQVSRRFARRKIARTWNRNLDLWFGDYPEIRRRIEAL